MNPSACVGSCVLAFESTIVRLRPVRVILLMAGLAAPAFGQFRDWQAGNGNWSTAGNWTPNGVPLSTETARIGNHAAAANSEVDLDANDLVTGLQITDGMLFDLNAFSLGVSGGTAISGMNTVNLVDHPSTLRVRPSAAATEFSTSNLTLSNHAELNTILAPTMQVAGLCSIDGTSSINAGGAINFTSNAGVALRNDGSIASSISALSLNQLGTGLLDLDGTSGDGSLLLNVAGGSDLTVDGSQLTDPFSGTIYMVSESRLEMNLDQPWEADASSLIHVFYPFVNPFGPSTIDGAAVTLAGAVDIDGTDAELRIQADATVNPTAALTIGYEDVLRFQGDATINGGSFDVGTGGALVFEGSTLVNAGLFQTDSTSPTDGVISFAGATNWSGNVLINGAARQNGVATVSAASVINAGEFDMDGGGGVLPTTWNINSGLVINALRVDEPDGTNSSGRFDGTMNFAPNILSRLTVNITDPAGFYWQMNGHLNFTGNPAVLLTQLAGDYVAVTGDVNVTAGRILADCPMSFSGGSSLTIGPANGVLRTNSDFIIYNATFSGDGQLQCGPDGRIAIYTGNNLQGIGVRNEGELTFGSSGALVSMDRYQQTSEGELQLDIGGHTPGVDHDLIVVTDGQAQLDGVILVDLTSISGHQFYPQVGDEFVVISADAGVVGSFDSDPVTQVNDLTFEWAVESNGFNVSLRVVSVTPACPGDTNGDGLVNGADVSVLLAQFGQSVEQWSGADLNGDGQVNGQDLSVLLANFGDVCGPTSASV